MLYYNNAHVGHWTEYFEIGDAPHVTKAI